MGAKKRRVDKAARGKAGETAGRVGLAARGSMYCVVGALAIRLVTGADERVDRDGALEALARQRLGSVLLSLLALGFAGYAIWRLLRAITGAREGSAKSGKTSALRRLGDVGRAALYAGLLFTTLRVLFGGREEVGGRERERDGTSDLLSHSWGRPVVLAIGVATVLIGVLVVGRGLQKDFEKTMDTGRVPTWARRLLPVAGAVGYAGRGAVVSIVGWFIARAAWQFDPEEAVGVAGALGRLSHEVWGRVVLSGVAFGLLSFGVFSFVEAAYRKVLED